MKTVTFFLVFLLSFSVAGQSVGINNSGAAPDASAMLDVQSDSKGMLIPRMTQVQRDAIAMPANGLLVFQTDEMDGFYYNEGTPGSPQWKSLSGGSSSDTVSCETRTPIDSLPWTIDQPGSYFVTRNLVGKNNQNGITIKSNNVFLDLNGFELRSGGGTAGDGIFFAGTMGNIDTNVCVSNGTIIGWGDEGINANSARNSRIENIKVMNNQADGILTGRDNVIINCMAINNGVDGIDGDFSCLIKNCVAMNNGDNGIESNSGSTIINCTAYQNGDPTFEIGNGINTSAGCSVLDCTATDNYRFGFNVGNAGIVKRCVATLNTRNGFFCAAACLVEGNTSRLNDGVGFPLPQIVT